MRVDATDAPLAAAGHANAGDHRDDVRTPPLSPSAAASDAAFSSADGSQFWCHECDANVATRVDEATDEVCCQRCGGNFVEEVEAVGCYMQLRVLLLLASLSACTARSCYCNCVCLRRMIRQKCSAATWQNQQQQVLRQLPCRLQHRPRWAAQVQLSMRMRTMKSPKSERSVCVSLSLFLSLSIACVLCVATTRQSHSKQIWCLRLCLGG